MLEGLPIITDRLLLNEFTEGDAPFVLQLMSSPDYIQNIGDRGIKTEAEAAIYIKEKLMPSYKTNGFGFYLVRLRHMDFPMGLCGMVKRDHLDGVDLGFAFLPEYHGQGYAYESSLAVIDHAYKYHDIKKLIAVTIEENTASIKLLTRLGFRFDKTVAWSESEDVQQYVLNMESNRSNLLQ